MSDKKQILPLDSKELEKRMNFLAVNFPFLQFGNLGCSILGNDIPYCLFGKGKKHILLVGTHHGMEWMTGLLLLEYVQELCFHYQSGKKFFEVSPIAVFEHYTLHIIPVLNPDGANYQILGIRENNPLYERVLEMNHSSLDFSHWQANARGVDLNHNYDSDFTLYRNLAAKNGIDCGGPTRYAGEEPESEPEVKALCNHIRFFREEWKMIVSFHTQGEEIYDTSNQKTVPGVRARTSLFSALCGYSIANAEGLASYSGLTDWCIGQMNLPCFTVECGKGKNPLPIDDFGSIYRRLKKALFRLPTLV